MMMCVPRPVRHGRARSSSRLLRLPRQFRAAIDGAVLERLGHFVQMLQCRLFAQLSPDTLARLVRSMRIEQVSCAWFPLLRPQGMR